MKIKYSPVKNYCIQNQISLLQPENLKCIDFQNDLKNLKADLYVIVAFKFLPKAAPLIVVDPRSKKIL